jgi:hypothetical protein
LDPIKRREKKEGSEKGEREAAWISLVGSFSPSVCVCVCPGPAAAAAAAANSAKRGRGGGGEGKENAINT